jgi:putative tryptophan/tyrosine transport system substrate-binding protein
VRPIRRRLLLGAAALAVTPLRARAQTASRIRRIGFLSDLPAAHERARWTEAALVEALRASGYEIGRNLLVEWRWGDGDPAGLPALAEDLVRREVELIVAWSNADTAAAMRASGTIPIVMLFGYAPVETGLVKSLAHPGGNVTGTAWLSPETAAKTLQILKEAKPSANRIASLAHRVSRPPALTAAFDRAARLLGLEIDRVEVTHPERLPEALERVAAGRPDALYVAVNPTLQARMRDIGDFARERRLVSLGTTPSYVLDGGGLLSYSPQGIELVARAATYVERILGGADPAGMPVALPQKFALLIHAGTARAMGYTVPASLLLRADRVIE